MPTGVFVALAVPPSPEEPSTVTPFCARRHEGVAEISSDRELPKASSAEAKLWEMTCAMWLSTTYFSAFIMFGKPWTPSVSAPVGGDEQDVGPGAIACAVSTSRATSSAQALLSSLAGALAPAAAPWSPASPSEWQSVNVGMPGVQVTPSSPHMGAGRRRC